MKTLIKNGRIVTASQDYFGDILVENGTVSVIGSLGDVPADVVVDATNKLVFPGAIDAHTHFGTTFMGVSSDDFEKGTIAAAVGGNTTVLNFAMHLLGEDMRASLEDWFRKAEGQTAVDYGFHQVVTELSDSVISDLDVMVKEGISSYKLYMAYPGLLMVDDQTLFQTMRRSSENGAYVMVHCENGQVIDTLVKEAVAKGNTDPIYHAKTRPSIAEGEATARAIALAEIAKVPLYIVHLSAAEALDAVKDARGRGLPVYAETCPHYLLLTEDVMAAPDFEGAKYVVTPPLRTPDHQAALWGGLKQGDLQLVATDHGALTFKDRDRGRGDFSKIPTGLPGVETRVSLLYHHGVSEERITLNRFVELVSTNPAKLFGLYPRKGEIAPGSDGDLVVFDPQREITYSVDTLVTDCDFTPYEGWTVRGVPEIVLLRGTVIVDHGKYVGKKGQGQFLRRGESSAIQ